MSFSQAVAIRLIDPLEIHTELRLSGTFYPLGYRLHIATNSRHVLEAAAESWGHYAEQWNAAPIDLRVIVRPEGEACGEASHRVHGHLYSVVSDRHNFAMFDLRTLSGCIYVSERTSTDHSRLRWFYVESPAYTLLAQRKVTPVHAACIARGAEGILLCGPSGAGKSTLAYACARAGWTYVSDDCVFLLNDSADRMAIGRHLHARLRVDAPSLFPELGKYIPHERPNGKVAIEVPMSAFPQVRTAGSAPVAALVFLERGTGKRRTEPLMSEDAAARIRADLPSFGDEVDARHEQTIRRLAEAPAFLLRYESIEDAIGLLAGVGLR